MKIGIYADAHFSLSSSIVIGLSGSLQGRLDVLIKSFEWMFKFFQENEVDLVVNLGDLTDKPHLRAEEITALQSALAFSGDFSQIHILGNHEALTANGDISAVNFLKSYQNSTLITTPQILEFGGRKILFLPYGKYEEKDLDEFKADILFSHIDIKDSYIDGAFVLKEGISPDYLAKKFGLTINGHIHTGSWVRKNILNIGSLSSLNFSSLGSKWKPSVGILDVEAKKIDLFENPYALQFAKFEVNTLRDLKDELVKLKSPEYYVLQVKIPYDLRDEARKLLDNFKVNSSRIISKITSSKTISEDVRIDKITSIDDGFVLLVKYFSQKQKTKDFTIADINSVIAEVSAKESI